MSDTHLPEDVDRRLRVSLVDNRGVAYLTGNSHTSRGRMSAYHESGFDITISKSDIDEATEAAMIWVDGFLSGSEPPLPPDADSDIEAEWFRERERYRSTGVNMDWTGP